MTSAVTPLLAVRGLGKSFGGNRAVDGIDFDIAPGELLALIGPNGAGKSTTFNMVNGQLKADSGSIQLLGAELIGLKPRQIWKLGVGRTFQIAETFASLTVLENVQMALLSADSKVFSIFGNASQHRRDDALALLAQVGMAEQAQRPCSVLAYGDVKRVELAVALAHAPKLLLMDEPTAGMAPRERNELMELTKRLVVQRQLAVLFTEHSMDVVFAHADRVIVLARGRLIAAGLPAEIRDHPKVQEVYFGTGKTFGATLGAAGDGPAAAAPSAAAPSAPASPATLSAAIQPSAQPLLDVRRLSAWYGGAHILFDIALQVHPGEVVALMGRNGAGKSTTLKSIMGMVSRRSGQVQFRGSDISRLAPHAIASAGLGYVPEDRRIFTDLTVLENLTVGQQAPRSDSVEAGSGPAPRPAWTPERLFKLFPNLGEMPHRAGGRMSGGEQQMLTVARTLMGNPYLVLLDEPSEGVAPVIVEGMVQMILELKAAGVSILLSEQNLHFAKLVSDRVYVLEKGQIRYQGTMASLAANEEVRRAYLSV